jgi:hypothetical protein
MEVLGYEEFKKALQRYVDDEEKMPLQKLGTAAIPNFLLGNYAYFYINGRLYPLI